MVELLKITIAQILSQAGFEKIHGICNEILVEVTGQYIQLLARKIKFASELDGRTTSNLLDVILAFEDLKLDADSLQIKLGSRIDFSRLEPGPFPLNIDAISEVPLFQIIGQNGPNQSTPSLPWPPRVCVDEYRLPENEVTTKISEISLSVTNDVFCRNEIAPLSVSSWFLDFNDDELNHYEGDLCRTSLSRSYNPSESYLISMMKSSRNIQNRSITFKSHLINFVLTTHRMNISDIQASLYSRQSIGRGILDDIIDISLPLAPNLFSSNVSSQSRKIQTSTNKIKLKFVAT